MERDPSCNFLRLEGSYFQLHASYRENTNQKICSDRKLSIERLDKTLLINPPVKHPVTICQNIFAHFNNTAIPLYVSWKNKDRLQ
jgi:hypothetical protein